MWLNLLRGVFRKKPAQIIAGRQAGRQSPGYGQVTIFPRRQPLQKEFAVCFERRWVYHTSVLARALHLCNIRILALTPYNGRI